MKKNKKITDQQQPRLANLTLALQLPHRTSPRPNPGPPTFFLRGDLLTGSELKNTRAYELEEGERGKRPDQLQEYYKRRLIPGYSLPNGMNPLLLNTSQNNLSLYIQGYRNILGQTGSIEGINFLHDTIKWQHLVANDNAAQLLMEPWDIFHQDYENHKVLQGGMQTLPLKLLQQFKETSPGATVKLKHRLECIREKHGFYQLIFIKTNRTNSGAMADLRDSAEVCSKKVVLAIPPKALKEIEWKPFDSHFVYRQSLNSVSEYPVLRVFFLYTSLWSSLEDVPAHFQDVYTDLPIHHFKYLGKYPQYDKTYYAFMVAEAEGDNLKYLQGLLDLSYFDCDHVYKCRDSQYLVRDISRQIETLLKSRDNNLKDLPDPDQVIINDWSKNTGTGSWYNWRKGVMWDFVEKNMTKPEYKEDVYFVGHGFCGGQCQHNVDGVFHSVDHVIDTYFNASIPE